MNYYKTAEAIKKQKEQEMEKWEDVWVFPAYIRNGVDEQLAELVKVGFVNIDDIEKMDFENKCQFLKQIKEMDGIPGYGDDEYDENHPYGGTVTKYDIENEKGRRKI